MAFGLTPAFSEELYPLRFSQQQFLALAVESAEKCGWIIIAVTGKGFIAALHHNLRKRNAHITFKMDGKKALITSESTGSELFDWGRNRRNVSTFLGHFNKLKYELTEAFLDEKYSGLTLAFSEEVVDQDQSLAGTDKIKDFFSFFIPVKGFFITPLLIDINILIFLAMVLSGVHFFMPDNESLVLWGANFRPSTIDGGWWRLFSSLFIHIGVFHLLMNMYALIFIGLLLEPRIGSVRFAIAYAVTGIAASSASLWWHNATISAGASGAIFGLYGVFLALLTTNLIEKSFRKPMLVSIGIFVGYNLLTGLKEGIDNAAHIGGLLSGILIGFSLYYMLSGKLTKHISTLFPASAVTAIAVVCYFLVTGLNDPLGEYDRSMKQFSIYEDKALQIYSMVDTKSDREIIQFIQYTGLPSLRKCRNIILHLDSLEEMPETLRTNIRDLKKYCDFRIESFELMYKAISNNSHQYDAQINNLDRKLDLMLRKFNGEDIDERELDISADMPEIRELPDSILYVIDGKPILGKPVIDSALIDEILFLDIEKSTQLYGDKGKHGACFIKLK